MPSLPRHVRRHRASGKFRAVVSSGGGKRAYGPLRATPDEAAVGAAEMLAQRGGLGRRRATLRDAYDLLAVDLRQSGARPDTVSYYAKQWRCLTGALGWSPEWPLDDLTTDQVHGFAVARQRAGNQPRTVWKQNVQALRRMTRLAARRGLVAVDPLANLIVPRTRGGRFEVLTPAKVGQIIDQILGYRGGGTYIARERDALLVELLFRTGLRRSELARLRIADIDLDGKRFHIDGKTGNRVLPITDRVGEILAALATGKRPTDVLVGDPEMIGYRLALWKKRLGEPHFSAHVLRHSFATAMVEAGVETFVLAELMGHADVRQSARYYHGTTATHHRALSALETGSGHLNPGARTAADNLRRWASSRDSAERDPIDDHHDSTADELTR